ncbi:MAG: hypothetical protein NTX06_01815 [Proteobacteria bacterium]|nr:hypothetical protein [Pseudomonadota bacterium]
MKKQTVLMVFILLGVFYFVAGSIPSAQATVFLMDNKLLVNGYFKEQTFYRLDYPDDDKQFHESKFDYLRTSLFFESLYKLHTTEDLQINLFGGLRYWYEAMPSLDSRQHDAVAHWSRREYERPKGEEYITEAYVDIIKGPLELKIGKQIVVWGELDLQRAADVINPVDVRHGSPGTDDWENIKQGLWMFRSFYQTDLPGQLLFETIIIPGDFKYAKVPIEGTHNGPSNAKSFNPGYGPTMYEWIQEKARRDAPSWDLGNTELGLRLRGNTYNVDWTLFYFNTLSDVAVANPKTVTPFSLIMVKSGIKSILTGSQIDPHFPGYEVFDYKRYQVFGLTAQTIVEKLHGSEWRLEMIYEINNHYNKGTDHANNGIYGVEERNLIGGGLSYADRFTMPWITHTLFDDKKITTSITLFYEKVLGDFSDIIVAESGRGHRYNDSHATMISYSFQQQFWKSQWMIMLTGSYNPIGKYFICPILSYAPGSHWRWEAALPIYGSGATSNRGMYRQDSILLRARYEF